MKISENCGEFWKFVENGHFLLIRETTKEVQMSNQ
jgi:hypothetical protein